ncbi:MAG TPA: hypothetical protein VIN71_05080 [Pseudomonadales bacterium]
MASAKCWHHRHHHTDMPTLLDIITPVNRQRYLSSRTAIHPGALLDASQQPVMKDYLPSLVIRLPQQQQVLKLVRARKWVEYAKMLWGRSRASKEIRGNLLLHEAGIAVPAISEYGYGLFPARAYQFIGYYIMQDLQPLGFDNARFLFLENRIDGERRHRFLANLVHDVKRMQQQRIVFNDLKFENIFCNAAGDICWIDTGVSVYPRWQQGKFRRKHNDAIDYLLLHHEKFLTAGEAAMLRSLADRPQESA